VTRAIDKLARATARNPQLRFDPVNRARRLALDALIDKLSTRSANTSVSEPLEAQVQQAVELAGELQDSAKTTQVCRLGEQMHLRALVAPACTQLRQQATTIPSERIVLLAPQSGDPPIRRPAVTGTITNTSGQVWSFSGQAGQMLLITPDETGGDLQPQLAFFAPDFAPLQGWSASRDGGVAPMWFLTLPTTGEYLLSVHSAGETTGDYALFMGQFVENAKAPMLQSLLSSGWIALQQGKLEEALLAFTFVASADPESGVSAGEWDTLCWQGSLQGLANKVVDDACERAVVGASETQVAAFRDSRGLARALTGNVAGALEDFQFFVAWSEEHQQYADHIQQRKEWIAALERGEDPLDIFDKETLLSLK
jgi:hypothetical protein